MIKEIKSALGRHYNNVKGWSTNRKIVVIESDDWGSIRMPSRKIYDDLRQGGLKVANCAFCKFDALASESDLKSLFSILTSHRDKNGNHPVITANTIVANPDFDKIKASGYKEYHYELFTETLKSYPEHAGSLDLWKEGIAKKVFYPQLHGREHLNVARWMNYLQTGSADTLLAFENRMFGLSTNVTSEKRRSFMAAFDYDSSSEQQQFAQILEDAQQTFHKLFGYRSRSFIAPNYTWGMQLESDLKQIGVEYIQSARTQILPGGEAVSNHHVRHHTGQRNAHGQIYLVRNCVFEPSATPGSNDVNNCLKQIATSFLWKKPAIIGSHRLNYIGFIDKGNRDQNLALLNKLLTSIVKEWPDVEFMTSDQLGDLIKNNENA